VRNNHRKSFKAREGVEEMFGAMKSRELRRIIQSQAAMGSVAAGLSVVSD
jgi:hypothetical protein